MTKVRRQPVAISIPDRRDAALTLGPALLVFAFGFLSPLINLAIESLKEFTPGRVGSVENAAQRFKTITSLQTRRLQASC
jgi:putative spermidine/putrescine transport system permease protein